MQFERKKQNQNNTRMNLMMSLRAEKIKMNILFQNRMADELITHYNTNRSFQSEYDAYARLDDIIQWKVYTGSALCVCVSTVDGLFNQEYCYGIANMYM